MGAQHTIFISYHRADAAVARRMREHLAERGAATWMDEFDIPAGAYWPDEIDKGLDACDTVIGLLSPDSIASRNVKNEWDWALHNDRRLLLMLVRPCTVPHRYISINWIDATDGDLDTALASMASVAGVDRKPPAERTATAIPETHYARSGDGSVAWQVFGEGPVDLVLVPGMISHVEHEWNSPDWARFLRRLGSMARVVRFDKRGTGLSDRVGRVLTMEERMDDIRAVMDAAHLERAVIFGVSEGGSLSALFAATHPDRTLSLLIYAGLASYVTRSDYPWPPSAEEYQRKTDEMAETLHERWGTEAFAAEILDVMAPSAAGDPEIITWFSTELRLGASPGAEIARRRMNIELDTRSVLPTIGVPAMVLHRTGDRDVNVEEGRYLAEHIPGAYFFELPGEDHFPDLGDQDMLFGLIGAFLDEAAVKLHEPEELGEKLATVLCLMLPLGGQKLTGVLADEAESAREEFGGVPIARGPHQMTALFDGSIRATRCALRLGETMRGAGCEARIGLHTGEVDPGSEPRKGDAVDVATQLASLARSGDILASAEVRNLAPGSGIAFVELCEHVISGLNAPVQVFQVDG